MTLTAIIAIILSFFGFSVGPETARHIDATIQSAQHETATTTIASSTPRTPSEIPRPAIPDAPAQSAPVNPTAPIIIVINKPPMNEEVTSVPAPAPEAPVAEEALVPSTILVENISQRPAYTGCNGAPVATFFVRVFDQKGKAMAGQEVTVATSTVGNFPDMKVMTAERSQGVGALINITIKDFEGDVLVDFASGHLKTPTQTVSVMPVPSPRPAYCDPLPLSIEDSSNTHTPTQDPAKHPIAQALKSPSAQG